MFSDPSTLFNDEMLEPELQSMEDYVDGINNIVETQQRIALKYFEDGTIELACPPLKALLHIMAYGEFDGLTIDSPELRGLFSHESMINSDWYQARLNAAGKVRKSLWQGHVDYLENFLSKPMYQNELDRLSVHERLERAKEKLASLEDIVPSGTIGVDPHLVD